jgi:thiamine biosynthesis protein ThiS
MCHFSLFPVPGALNKHVGCHSAASRNTSTKGVICLKLLFNGFMEEFDEIDLSIQELLDRNQEDDPAVIVEVNGRFVHRKDFESFQVRDGDRVEFIHPSFGG